MRLTTVLGTSMEFTGETRVARMWVIFCSLRVEKLKKKSVCDVNKISAVVATGFTGETTLVGEITIAADGGKFMENFLSGVKSYFLSYIRRTG